MNRRDFLRSSAALATVTSFAATATSAQTPATSPTPSSSPKPKRKNPKGFMWQMLSGKTAEQLSVTEKFKLIKGAGFDGVEPVSGMDQKEVLAARDATGLQIASVCIGTHWKYPLSDPSPANRQLGLDGLKQGLRDAKAYGASSVLLVPAVVNKQVSYTDAYTRCTEEIKKAIPLAEELGVAIAIENVWNWFLLSPREAVAFADSFKSPMVKWHFDVGNVVNTGWPEQWVRELGPRIAKVHVKEFSKKLRDTKGLREGFKVDLMAGDSDWPAVIAALDSVNYTGWLIAEQWRADGLTDQAYLEAISQKLDAILSV